MTEIPDKIKGFRHFLKLLISVKQNEKLQVKEKPEKYNKIDV